jgi:phospho-N-acetylmuramoyl-pentapeptide-transferase
MNPFALDAVTVLVAGLIGLAVYPPFIRLLARRKAGQVIQEELPPEHQRKAGTPTGGGILFVTLAILGGLLATAAGHPGALPAVAGLVLGGLIGLADDLRKLRVGSLGIPARAKFPLQFLLAIPVAWLAYQPHQWPLPFVLPWWAYWPLALVAIVGAANAVNITDGMDGLCGGLTALAVFVLALLVPRAAAGERATAMALLGGLLAFLFYNRHPARVFMGDTGSLGAGYALAAMAVQQGFVLLLPLLGLVFVLETLSVIIQVAYFKATGGRRVFKMAPIHFTFQLEGWPEPRIVGAFWAAGGVAAVASVLVARV